MEKCPKCNQEMSSDICKVPEFKAEEDVARGEIETAKTAIPKVIAALRNISHLLDEAEKPAAEETPAAEVPGFFVKG